MIRNLLLLVLCSLYGNLTFAQQTDENRMKIEIIVKQGKEEIKAKLSSAAISFSRPPTYGAKPDSTIKSNADLVKERMYYMAIYLDRQSVGLMRAFLKNKDGIDGYLTMEDTYGKIPSRKIEFKSAILDALSDQLALEPTNVYMTIKCGEMIIDGIKIDY